MISVLVTLSIVLVQAAILQCGMPSKFCEAPYYGSGNGDGVLDPRCFELQTELSKAAYNGDVKKMKKLLRSGANADSSAGEYLPPLYGAAAEGKTEAVLLLLDNGAIIDRKYSLNGPPLFAAIYGNHFKTVELLISRGADVNIYNGGETALKIAKRNRYEKIEILLQERGAKE